MCEFHTGVTADHTKRRAKKHISRLAWTQKCTSSLLQLPLNNASLRKTYTSSFAVRVCVYMTPLNMSFPIKKNNPPSKKKPRL